MNEHHARVCPSPEWAEYLHTQVLPKLTDHNDLGDHLVEVGPGPGASTDWLRHRVERLTAVEIDPSAAQALRQRFAGGNVEVVDADATHLPFPDGTFSSAGCFTMLHHVPTDRLQNQLLAELLRVLRPGGVLIGSDGLPSSALHEFHVDDVYNPVEPAGLLTRLRTLGFDEVTVSAGERLLFWARKAKE
jgi:ubiquinone/menaquinone biosynthesis C-methylase UbiE